MITREEARARWRGVLAPIVTPFKQDGALDLDALGRNVGWLFDRGACHGNTVVLAAGSGGDFTSMSLAERKKVIQTIAETVAGRAPVIAGAQSLDVRECIELCQFCEHCEIDAVQISGPFYYDGRPGDVLAWMNEVARQTRIGFAIYNNWYTGYDMPLDLIDRLLEIPNSVGVKWASPRADIFLAGIRRFAPKVTVLNNTFQTVLGHLAGCSAFVSHWPNFHPEWCWRLWDLMESSRFEQAQQELDRTMAPYEELVAKITAETAGEGVFVRPMMAAVGLDGGHSRLPSRDSAVTPEIQDRLRQLLVDVGALAVAG
ncbi:MAG: dihydrodipicolinate synthase family protein [Thermomicrobiales bacterium]